MTSPPWCSLLQGLTYAETAAVPGYPSTAAVLAVSQAAVRSRLMPARRAIRTHLLEAGITEEEDSDD